MDNILEPVNKGGRLKAYRCKKTGEIFFEAKTLIQCFELLTDRFPDEFDVTIDILKEFHDMFASHNAVISLGNDTVN